MERTQFIAALEQPNNVMELPDGMCKQLVQEYPYAILLQLLHHKQDGLATKTNLKKLGLHFENPLHLSQALIHFELKESGSAAVSKQSKIKVAESDSKKKMRIAEKAKAVKQTPVAETNQIHQQESIVEPIIETEQQEAVAEETDEQIPAAIDNPTDDVLELINELPEENPIKSVSQENETIEVEPETAEDPGDLMVMMSFTDWLQYFKAKKENEEEDKKGKDAIRSAWQKEKLAEAMDDEEDVVPDEIFEKAMKSVSFGDGLVTEPLAELYVKQGKTEKAIELYKKLSLLNPEKKVYFASRIKDLHLLK